MEPLKVTRKKKGNWFTHIIKNDSTLPTQAVDVHSSDNDDNKICDE
jgi:hypothetical protein